MRGFIVIFSGLRGAPYNIQIDILAGICNRYHSKIGIM